MSRHVGESFRPWSSSFRRLTTDAAVDAGHALLALHDDVRDADDVIRLRRLEGAGPHVENQGVATSGREQLCETPLRDQHRFPGDGGGRKMPFQS